MTRRTATPSARNEYTEGEEDDKDEDGTDTGAEGAEEEGNAEAGAEAEGTEEDTHSDKPPWPGKAVRCRVDRTAGFRPWRGTPSIGDRVTFNREIGDQRGIWAGTASRTGAQGLPHVIDHPGVIWRPGGGLRDLRRGTQGSSPDEELLLNRRLREANGPV